MIYFVTGASGFIGRRLVRKLLEDPEAKVYYLLRNASAERVRPCAPSGATKRSAPSLCKATSRSPCWA